MKYRLYYIIIFIFLLTGLGSYQYRSSQHIELDFPFDPEAGQAAADGYKILFIGDTSFGENYQESRKRWGEEHILETKGYDHPLKNFKSILLSSDLVIANLETPITQIKISPIASKKTWLHWTDIHKAPEYLKKHNIKTVSLANNHTLDYGVPGLRETLNVLRDHDMEWFGAGLDQDAAAQPYMKEAIIGQSAFKFTVIGAFEYRLDYEEDLNFYAHEHSSGVNKLAMKKMYTQIRKLKIADPNLFVIVFPHWGFNYKWKTKEQTQLAHQIIDAGADMIIGHGAHMMQEIEHYQGRWIIYSLGNFMFNVDGRYKKFRVKPYSLVAQLVLKEEHGTLAKNLRLYPIFTDNVATDFQGRFVTGQEFKKVHALLLKKSPASSQLRENIKTGQDDTGFFMQFRIADSN